MVATAKKRAPAKKKVPAPLNKWQRWSTSKAATEELCAKIIGGETLTNFARNLAAGVSTLTDWIAADPERSARVREARIAAANSYDELALQAIRDASDPFELAKAKEEAHHLRWKASKADPGRYGDKLDVKQELTVKNLSDEQLDAEIARLSAAAGLVPRAAEGTAP